MKKTLSVIAVLAVLAVPASSLFARGGGYGGGPGYGNCAGPGFGMRQPFHNLDRMQYYLGLSDDQVDSIYKINRDYQDKYYQNRKNFDKIQTLRNEHNKAIEKVLTKTQKEKWNDFLKNHPRRGWKNGRGPGYKR